ncbi:MAG: GNAT family N-acetyltransferase [Chitinophagia bacterium]|nr:GNAT family N-acetyltransferase [Chitinophagia bacterium]
MVACGRYRRWLSRPVDLMHVAAGVVPSYYTARKGTQFPLIMTPAQTRYADYCARNPGTPVFAQHWWLQAVCLQWDAVVLPHGDGYKGAWAYPIERQLGVPLLRTPVLTPYLGPHVAFPPDMKPANRDGFEWETIDELLKHLPNIPYCNLALNPGLKQAGLLAASGYTTTVRQTFLLPLQPGEAALLANMKETVRKNIRTAEFDIVTANDPATLEALFHFHRSTLGKKSRGVAHTLAQMHQLHEACIAHHQGNLYAAKMGGQLLAVAWHVWDAQRGYYFMGAQNPEGGNYRAITALIWHCIKETMQRGIPEFDLEGSMDPGVERFYRGFGAQRELYLIAHRNTSWLMKLKEMVRG